MNSMPSPIARPRLSQPQQMVEIVWPIWDQCSHRISTGLGIEREDVVVAGADVHDAVFDERRRLVRIFAAEPGAFEAGHPGSLELLDVGGVDLLQRRIALVGHVAAVGDPVLADRALQQAVDLRIGSLDRHRREKEQAESHRHDPLNATRHSFVSSRFRWR